MTRAVPRWAMDANEFAPVAGKSAASCGPR